MAKRSAFGSAIANNKGYPQKRRFRQKEKKKQKKKNVLKYGKLYKFPTFQHDKQQQVINDYL